jgi:hypothetical protein
VDGEYWRSYLSVDKISGVAPDQGDVEMLQSWHGYLLYLLEHKAPSSDRDDLLQSPLSADVYTNRISAACGGTSPGLNVIREGDHYSCLRFDRPFPIGNDPNSLFTF